MAKGKHVDIAVAVSLDELQKVVDQHMADRETDSNVKVTLTGPVERHFDKDFVLATEQFVSGYGSNHRPETAYWAFAVEDGRIVVIDCMNAEMLEDRK